MTKRKRNPAKEKETSRSVQVSSSLRKATGSQNKDQSAFLLSQLLPTLWVPEGTSEEKQNQAIRATLATLEGIAPQNELEGLLAAQMVSTHSAAMECLRRAMLQGQTFEGRDQNLKHAAKLLSIYLRQVETLDKHRGKGRQKITVEHVNVHAGGQAIVGEVKTDNKSAPAPPALENNPDPVVNTADLMDAPKRKAGVKVRPKDGG